MRRFVLLLVVLAASCLLLVAEENKNATTMTATVCNSKCVYQQAAWPEPRKACSSTCAETEGDMVLIDDAGRAFKISNPEKLDKMKSHMGKKMKVKAMMNPQQDTLDIHDIVFAP